MKKEVKINIGGVRYEKFYTDLKETDCSSFIDRMTNACIKHHYENKELELQRLIIKHQRKVINRLSRKIQKLKSGTFSINEINKMLFCFDYIANECGYDYELAKIYEKLYAYRERLKYEKKGF